MGLLFLHNAQRSTHSVTAQNRSVARCALPVALVGILALLFVLVQPCFSSLYAAEPVMKTLSAHVVKVAEDGSSIEVDFRHPATEEVQHLTFYVDGQTGLSGIEKLQELRSGQVVNIDYVEGEKRRLLIRYIARVKLSGPPSGLEKFRGL